MDSSNKLKESDFYLDESGNFVFTASYHKRRGYCCQSGCLHCPYKLGAKVDESVPIELSLKNKDVELSLEDQAQSYLDQYEDKD